MTNWKTTVGGIVAAVGAVLAAQGPNDTWKLVGAILSAVGITLVGAAAKDHNK